jgi:ATP-dependent helicase HrpA
VAEGICIRLYSEENFNMRSEFTDPEILRTNLAQVILQMQSLRLGRVEDFPFVQPPSHKHIKDGVTLLKELNAVSEKKGQLKLTSIGRIISQLPLDPRMARMVYAQHKKQWEEVLIIVAFLSVQDPRERPQDFRQKADQAHAKFKDKESDFATIVNLWRYIETEQKEKSKSAFRKACPRSFLNFMRIREWQSVVFQLKSQLKEMGYSITSGVENKVLHQAILPGLLSHVGFWDEAEKNYQGARNKRFYTFPASSLFKRAPKWVMAAELMET